MRLIAHEVPPPSAEGYDGRVHSVFRRVINLSREDGGLWTVYAGAADIAPPGAISVRAPDGMDFSQHVAHGSRVACRGGVLRIVGSDVSVDLRSARTSVTAESNHHRLPEWIDFGPAWQVAWHCLMTRCEPTAIATAFACKPPAGSLDSVLARRARRAMFGLIEAFRASSLEAASEAAAPLLGAGPGVTPSGDDFLVGFLFGASHACAIEMQSDLVRALGHRLASQPNRTGEISGIYLMHAAEGRVAPALAKLAYAITTGVEAGALEKAIASALRIGHTSGADAAFGLLCGLAACRRDLAEIVLTLRAYGTCQIVLEQ